MVTDTAKSHQRVPPKALLVREVLVVDPQLLGSFVQIVRFSLDRLLANRREARTLAQTRTTYFRSSSPAKSRLVKR